MTAKECIIQHPNFSNQEVATFCGISKRSVENARYRLKAYKEISEDQPALAKECDSVGLDLTSVKSGWYKGEHWSIYFGDNKPILTYDDMADAIIEKMNQFSPIHSDVQYALPKDPHLFVYDPADVHFNKLAMAWETGEDYNSQIAVKRCREGLRGLLNKAYGYKFDKILFILGNDILNADGPSNSTTKGTRQDTHTLWFDAYLMAYGIMCEQIETLAAIAPVHVVFNPSNHDVMSGFFLAHAISAHFRLHKGVTFDYSTRHRKYYRYGMNLIGSTHGDGAKSKDLPLLMAAEAKKDWGECKHYYVYTHHIHHKDAKDYGQVCVESMRSPSGPDGWHSRNGYGAPKAIEAFIHHPEHGQIARLSHIF